MSDTTEQNVYAVPEAEVETSHTADGVEPEFHVTGTIKVILFYVLSFGIYSLVWFYQQWRRQKIYAGEDCWPAIRAFFSIFFAYPLFVNIKALAEKKDKVVGWSAGLLATIYILSSIIANFSEQIVVALDAEAFVAIIITLCVLVIPGLTLFFAQKSVNSAYQGELEDMNEKFTLVNWVFVVLLLSGWGLGIYGIILG